MKIVDASNLSLDAVICFLFGHQWDIPQVEWIDDGWWMTIMEEIKCLRCGYTI